MDVCSKKMGAATLNCGAGPKKENSSCTSLNLANGNVYGCTLVRGPNGKTDQPGSLPCASHDLAASD